MKQVFSMTNSGRPDCAYDKQHPNRAAYKLIKSMEQVGSKKTLVKNSERNKCKNRQTQKKFSPTVLNPKPTVCKIFIKFV